MIFRKTGPHFSGSCSWTGVSPVPVFRFYEQRFYERREGLRGRHAASLLPHSASKTRVNALMGEKDRLRGFGRWSFILNLPNPLTPTLSPLGRGSSLCQLQRTCMASAFVLAARLCVRVFLCAIADGSHACKNVVTFSAKPVRLKGRAGVGPVFRSSVTSVSPDQSKK